MKLEKTTLLLAPIFFTDPYTERNIEEGVNYCVLFVTAINFVQCVLIHYRNLYTSEYHMGCALHRYRSPGGVGRSVAIVLQSRRSGRQQIRVLAGETFD